MKVSLTNGRFEVDGKEVTMLVFSDNSYLRFPIEDNNELQLDTWAAVNQSTIAGNGNQTTQGKNIVTGGNISVKGDFRVGDA